LHRDIDETAAWVAEKDAALSTDDYGRDLTTVQALQRKHEGTERDLAALEGKVWLRGLGSDKRVIQRDVLTQMQSLGQEAERLKQLHPDRAEVIGERQNDIMNLWDLLRRKAASRKGGLDGAYALHRFFVDFRDLASWMADVKAVIAADEPAKDVAGAEALLERHQEHKVSLARFPFAMSHLALAAHRAKSMRATTASKRPSTLGAACWTRGCRKATKSAKRLCHVRFHVAFKPIVSLVLQLNALESEKAALLALWEERRILYEQCMDLQLFYRDTDQAETWMTKQEVSNMNIYCILSLTFNIQQAFLSNEDLGDSLDSVEALIKKHEDFEKSLAAQEEKIKALDEFATKLIEGQHYAADDVAKRRQRVRPDSHMYKCHHVYERNHSDSSCWKDELPCWRRPIAEGQSWKIRIVCTNLTATATR